MLAGSIGWECLRSGEEMADGEGRERPDGMQPKSGWWIYEKGGDGEAEGLVEQE